MSDPSVGTGRGIDRVAAAEGGSADIRETVRARYAGRARAIALTAATDAACCPDDACGAGEADTLGDAYSPAELATVGIDLRASLGCGNPTSLAALEAGQIVLDLGSGAGLDVLLSARRVAPDGHAYGVDMTDEMLELARANQAKADVANATFLKGTIEDVPLPDASVDVVISNCVINLAADKSAVLAEAYRVLRPGGLLAVSDMVALGELAPEVKRDLDLWAGCVAGTISREEYLAKLGSAGFAASSVEITKELELPEHPGQRIASAAIRARKPTA